jgi:hypothetical protein
MMRAHLPKSVTMSRSAPLFLGVTVAALVFYGFSHTVERALIHFEGVPPPPILYVHALVSSAWLFLFVAQSALVRGGNVIHQQNRQASACDSGSACSPPAPLPCVRERIGTG